MIMAGNKRYQELSLGEKSIFGIKYKLSKSISNKMFLDQIEDNLDNKTIIEEIVKVIKEKDGQKFIVTHNANIGILTNVENVIVADKNNKNQNTYYKGNISILQKTNESDLAQYLEGGVKALEERHQIIKGNKQHEINY